MKITYTDREPGARRFTGISAILKGFAKQDQPCMEIACKDEKEMTRLYQSVMNAKWRLHKIGELERMTAEMNKPALTIRVYK